MLFSPGQSFTYTANPGRVIFGHGTIAQLPDEIERLGLKRMLVLSTPFQRSEAEKLAQRIGDKAADIFAGAVMHTPVNVTQDAVAVVNALGADGVVAIGGGSTTGLGKAIALRTGLPQIVVPTTYAGSEMTPILGETSDGTKTTRSDPAILPEVVIYDVDLTLGLPPMLSGTSGINAIAHAVEALYARDRNPVISLMALEGISALSGALPTINHNPSDRDARAAALYGAWLCGICLGAVGMALHHKLCHVIGGTFDLPHAETHTIILPHALAYNAPAIPEAWQQLQSVLGDDPALALHQLARKVGAPHGLGAIGMPEEGIDEATGRAFANPYWNPRPLEENPIRQLIARAWQGAPPAKD
ncbi:maleylacetate reductase [Sphingobium phenoxybenzoativorans]|uniref:maleylacetate reductase n=1 Tax=Sphingobium phenoxybenzoativorans TaxID=1592790 RepID=UPI00087259EF|nr:maleylacetate reductase [Sphingobium phenoxybenzoativorans]